MCRLKSHQDCFNIFFNHLIKKLKTKQIVFVISGMAVGLDLPAAGHLIILLWSGVGAGMRRVGRKPEGEGFRPQGGQGEGRTPADRRPVDRRPPRRFERPAGDAGEKPEGGEFSVEK